MAKGTENKEATMRRDATTIRPEDRELLIKMLRSGNGYGDSAKEMADAIGASVPRTVALAKRYEGIRFKGGTITYLAAEQPNWTKATPGIANPRTGICERIPASIIVKRRAGNAPAQDESR